MQFWRLSAPENETDYHDLYLNGMIDHPYGLPGVNCEVCGETWGGTRILPVECPEKFRGRKEITNGWPIDGPQHRALRAEVEESLGDGVVLRPGDDFQPAQLYIPSRPSSDFLWCSLGSVVVSDRVRSALAAVAKDDVRFAPVTLRKVGIRDPADEPLIPDDGEPEDVFETMEVVSDTAGIGPYWEMIVQPESELPRGVGTISVCSGCQRPSFDKARRDLVMHEDMWRGSPVFVFATTLWMIVTDDVRKMLVDMGATNVAFARTNVPPG